MRVFLLLLLVSTQVYSQSAASLPTNPSGASQADLSSFSLEKLKSKFRISYFSETLGPSIKKWDDNEIADDGLKTRQPMTMYHSMNVRYLWSEKFNVFVSPRFNTVFGDRNDLRPTQEQHNFYSDDWQFGMFYTWYRSPTFQYNNRLTHREPFSRKSRDEHIDSQIEWQHDLTWLPMPSLRIIHWNNYRFYAYDEEGTEERYRINFTTLFNYTLNDKWNVQYMHELDLQHRNTTDVDSRKHRDDFYFKRYKHYSSFGVGYSPIPTLTFIPFVRVMDERNIRNETTMVGLWILGRVLN